ncbi:DUF1059 domain-containing protein [Methanofollis formosanus]|uniref:DUF1059 domain-containing protein n=2 Tax=Methanofollis formosanus TaxID=299308 RepID=A0A8G1EH82_9EURY|nr:DUF1059 domain-containing protein [Methanofollis formosanus]
MMAMPSFKCKDIGMKCEFETTAENEFDLEQKIADHAREVHGKENLSAEEWMQIKKAIH